jgi:hypothetical protein
MTMHVSSIGSGYTFSFTVANFLVRCLSFSPLVFVCSLRGVNLTAPATSKFTPHRPFVEVQSRYFASGSVVSGNAARNITSSGRLVPDLFQELN